MIAQILWDLAGVICLAFSPLLQQWLFDYGLQSPLKKIVMVILAEICCMAGALYRNFVWNGLVL